VAAAAESLHPVVRRVRHGNDVEHVTLIDVTLGRILQSGNELAQNPSLRTLPG